MWENIKIEPVETSFNAYNQLQVRRCVYDNAEAQSLVTRTSTMSGNTYSDPMCPACAAQWTPNGWSNN